MKALNVSRNREIASDIAVADTFISRMKGLLGKLTLPRGGGLWIKPCNSIHTIGMKFSIDVLFLDRENRVIAIKQNFGPNRLSRPYLNASAVLELPAGTIDETVAGIGDIVVMYDSTKAVSSQ